MPNGSYSKKLVRRDENAISKHVPQYLELREDDDQIIDQSVYRPNLKKRKKKRLLQFTFSWIFIALCFLILLAAAISQRPWGLNHSFTGGQTYDIQVGGKLAGTWEKQTPVAIPQKAKIPMSQPGEFSVLGKPSISVNFINQVLASAGSPAAGKGKSLYDLGAKYGIDPAFALAFFMHESTFGTAGVARTTLSLGNLRCIPNARCVDGAGQPTTGTGYAAFDSWEQGFEAWYQLIRNLYIGTWAKSTIEQIIPTYAPNSDNNNEACYIKALRLAIETWRVGNITVGTPPGC